MRAILGCRFSILVAVLSCPGIAVAIDSTLPTGGGQPFSQVQPSLGVSHLIRINGPFDDLGEVGLFGGNFAPFDWAFPEGQLLSISNNPALFDKIGVTFGGDGISTFALPDLRGRTLIGQRGAPGLTPRFVGELVGQKTTTLTLDQLPSHDHRLPQGRQTDFVIGGQPVDDLYQPSFALTPVISRQGIFPSRSSVSSLTSGDSNPLPISGGFGDPFLAEVTWVAGNQIPDGWAPAFGASLPIAQNEALFSLLGTTYGGDGRTTFNLPDLRARAAVSAGAGPGLTNRRDGDHYGAESQTLGIVQLPNHSHPLPSGGNTGNTGNQNSFEIAQPSLPLNYLVALVGTFPSEPAFANGLTDAAEASTVDQGMPESALGTGSDPLLGSISLFAGNFAPAGYAFADGQLLPISQNTALFSIFGITFGGDGETTFGLPDLRGRVAVHPDQISGSEFRRAGQKTGADRTRLQTSQIPGHAHDFEEFLLGDYNQDGAVNAADYTVWRDSLGSGNVLAADGDGNLIIGQGDYGVFASRYGDELTSPLQSVSTPEPASLSFLVVGALMASAMRRKLL